MDGVPLQLVPSDAKPPVLLFKMETKRNQTLEFFSYFIHDVIVSLTHQWLPKWNRHHPPLLQLRLFDHLRRPLSTTQKTVLSGKFHLVFMKKKNRDIHFKFKLIFDCRLFILLIIVVRIDCRLIFRRRPWSNLGRNLRNTQKHYQSPNKLFERARIDCHRSAYSLQSVLM